MTYNTYDVDLFTAVAAADLQFVDERGTADVVENGELKVQEHRWTGDLS